MPKSICDTSTKTTLVEHFFNIIFTEFHNTPPVCVCVQMCPDQPTYCYPNGCLKRTESKKTEALMPVTKISENTKPIFFIDEKNDFMNDFLTKNYIDDNIPIVAPMPTQSENSMITNMRPDPFKDRYKILFKYKKMPKVELKYNHGEQVKNMKSEVLKTENVDVSKTRWPMNKIDRRMGVGQPSVRQTADVPKTTSNNRYFMSVFPGKDASYPPKYFKRELQNNTNGEVDIKAIYVVGKSESENNAFSLEKLIDSLIESSFDNNATSPGAGVETTTLVNEKSNQIEELNEADKDKSSYHSIKKETNIISMNFTNENVDKNKYSDDIMANNSKNVGDMIAKLSKRIEIQNNTSLEIMKRLTGGFEFESFSTTTEKPVETTSQAQKDTSTTELPLTTSMPIVYDTRTTRKIRKRIVRRLQNKNNK
ncbi:hypothetical protein PYW07_014210 [Mythimna separata]|uniref:Uncharacterized protein n=1 Tax=Mythimna separata TaxID=271217 RepID=A0AAD8E058_MYTSE|nr:hypothetical protein PYW07_014210 [Mythimna separata]